MTIFTTNSIAPANHELSALPRLAHWIKTSIQAVAARRAHAACLHRLKSRDLKDVGLIESDISAANRLPPSADAATALHLARLGRSRNW